MHGFRRVRECRCGGSPCVCEVWEGRLARAGLGHLEYEDGHGNVLLSNRGAGKVDDVVAAEARETGAVAADATLAKRRAILQHARFGSVPEGGRSRANRRLDRNIWELYAAGHGSKRIAATLHLQRDLVRRRIAEIWRISSGAARVAPMRKSRTIDRSPPRHTLVDLVRQSEPSMLSLVFALLRRALSEPSAIAEMLREAERVPELAACM